MGQFESCSELEGLGLWRNDVGGLVQKDRGWNVNGVENGNKEGATKWWYTASRVN